MWVDDNPGVASGSELLTAYGPTLMVDIGFDPAWKISTPLTIPEAGIGGVDKGAGESEISSK
jgi:hypothetical protein